MTQARSIEERLRDSTLELLRSGGPQSVTVEAVAAHSGVAKTTIYRRHRDRRALLADALTQTASPPPLDPQADAAQRLRWLITHAVGMVRHGIGFGGLAALLTKSDPDFTTLFQEMLSAQRGELAAAIDDGKANGSLRADVDNATLIDAIVGAYIAEYARSQNIDTRWEERLFDFFWPAVRPEPG